MAAHEGSGNGAPVNAPPAERPEAPREYHAEPRDSGPAHEVAHFEPAPRPEGPTENKPYVVWSSAPSADHGTGRPPEE